MGVEASGQPIYDPGLGGSPLNRKPHHFNKRNLGCVISSFLPGLPEVAGGQTPDPVVFGSVCVGGSFSCLGCLTAWVKPTLKCTLGLPILAQIVGPFFLGP